MTNRYVNTGTARTALQDLRTATGPGFQAAPNGKLLGIGVTNTRAPNGTKF